MPIYEITQFRGGPSDYDDKGIAGAFKMASNLDIRRLTDSLFCQQALIDEGLLTGSQSESASPSPSSSVSKSPSPSISRSPSPTPSPSASASPSASLSLSPSTTPSSSISPSPSPTQALTSIFRDLILFFVECSDGYLRGVGNTGYIYRRDIDGVWNVEYKDPDGGITGANEWFPLRKSYFYWVAGNKLKRKPLSGLTNWNDVETVDSNLNTATWHTMREAGGALVIANGPVLAMVGYDGSFANEALEFIPGNISKTIVERSGRSIIGTVRASNPTKGINGAIDSEYPLAQIGDDGEIFYADMNSTMPITRFPGGGKINPGGVTNEVEQAYFFEWEQTALNWIDKQAVGNMAMFAVFNADAGRGGIYKYGRKKKNHPFVLNLDHLLDADELGAITNFMGTTLVSYKDGSDFGVKAVDPDTKAVGTYESLDFKSPVKKVSEITYWKYAEIFCKPLPSGSKIEFYYKLDKNGSWIQSSLSDKTTQFTSANETKAVFNISEKAKIIEFKVVMTPVGNESPEIYKINIFFD